MGLAQEYARQRAWRGFGPLLDALPDLAGARVLDLGCGIGDQAAELVARGARVVGYDGNSELLEAARARALTGAEFHQCDLAALPELGPLADGLWSSFVPAYFCDLAPRLVDWARRLRPGAWIALTEVDDLFAHEPLEVRWRDLLEAYVREARGAGRYDFRMGRRLPEELERAGFRIERRLELSDQEFGFDGPARPEVLEAWSRRFERMTLLRAACGESHPALVRDFLAALARPDHRSSARVRCCLATWPGPREPAPA